MMGIFGRGTGFGLEVGHGVLRAASVTVKGGVRTLAAIDSEAIPEGTLLGSFTEPNIQDMPAFVRAAGRLAGRMGRRLGRVVNVVLPDFVARVVMLEFETLPAKAGDIDSMIRWKLKKLMPFNIDQAALRYQYLGVFREKDAERHRYVAAVIKSDLLAQYEAAFGEAGIRPGRIGTVSFGLWNLYHDYIMKEASGRGFCLLNLCCGKMTVMVFEGGVVRFFRLKDIGLEYQAAGGSADDGDTMLRELRASLAYYRAHVSDNPVELVFVAGNMGGTAEAISGAGFESRLLGIESVMGADVQLRANDGQVYSAACAAATER